MITVRQLKHDARLKLTIDFLVQTAKQFLFLIPIRKIENQFEGNKKKQQQDCQYIKAKTE